MTQLRPAPGSPSTSATARSAVGDLEPITSPLTNPCTATPAEDLEALGVDRPYWRWDRARRYIRDSRERALSDVRSLTRELLLYARAKRTWIQRGRLGAGPDRTDMSDALAWFEQTFVRLGGGSEA